MLMIITWILGNPFVICLELLKLLGFLVESVRFAWKWVDFIDSWSLGGEMLLFFLLCKSKRTNVVLHVIAKTSAMLESTKKWNPIP
jgi:hypothetical protein